MPSSALSPRRRIAAVLALAAVVAAGLMVHRMLPASAFADVAGDALYAVAIYTGLVVLVPRARSLALAVIAAAWCIAVELFQLTGVPSVVGSAFPPAALVLGAGFDPRDLVVYVAAVTAAALIDSVVRTRRGMPPRDERLDPA